MTKKKPKIKLRSPIVENPILTGGDGRTYGSPIIDISDARTALSQLAKQYEVEEEDWETLAFVLALKGGFIQVEKATGKIPHWGDSLRAALVIAVELWAKDRGKSITATFADTDFLNEWGELSGQFEQGATLSTRYHETRRIAGTQVGASFDVLWVLDSLPGTGIDTARVQGILKALLSQARLDRAHEKMMRCIATDMSKRIT